MAKLQHSFERIKSSNKTLKASYGTLENSDVIEQFIKSNKKPNVLRQFINEFRLLLVGLIDQPFLGHTNGVPMDVPANRL